MKKALILIIFLGSYFPSFSQKILVSWSQQNIQDYTKEMYDRAQALSYRELLSKNIQDESWSDIFLTLNASANNYSKENDYLRGLAQQITNRRETKLKGTSRLIIWNRVSSGDIIFEGKGLVIDNDLYSVGGRANQILQSVTGKNFGFITLHSTEEEVKDIQNKWLAHLSGRAAQEYQPKINKNAKIAEISSLSALEALIVSLQDNPVKNQITKDCLKNLYNLDEMPKERGSQASYCSPDTYTFAYLAMLFGETKHDESKDAKWWREFWTNNHAKLAWNDEKGIFEVSK